MVARQEHVVVLATADGGYEVHPLKAWLRRHPEHLPSGMSAIDNTSHELRAALKKKGWLMEETNTQVRLLMPSSNMPAEILTEDVANEGHAQERDDIAPLPVFSLEYQLRDFLSSNLNTIAIGGRRLKLYVDPTGCDGVEFQTDVGFIDILAVDETGAFYVFELKRGRSPDYVLGQLARYMGWVKQTIGRNVDVFGVIISREISSHLRYATSVVPGVHLFEYEVSFNLKPAHDMPRCL